MGRDPQNGAGEGVIVLAEDDCLSTVSERTGHFWETLWNLPDNAVLRAKRTSPNVLYAGDRVTVPPLRPKEIDCATGRRHVFRRRGVPAYLRMRFLRRGKARADVPYRIDIEGRVYTGRLDAEGGFSVALPPAARRGVLYLGEPPHEREIPLRLGRLSPVSEVLGVKMRLNNLGCDCGSEDDDAETPAFRGGVERFQRRNALPVTGTVDEATRQRILAVHGS